ncbi:tRNA pseudouridine(38-40) synthase TruA [Mucilaginibacter arboris]|uniref:tRNA pseudouridine synthase A n=1 Tax=Mucilaginibacter arboris TaxID=2682090 RepID=A0A7K1SYT1_9SPHI|nr:tRNA pseudouridine(38-40) synthase TruA [Mucilaginibacter arboris]MVN22475.1 tRNA pseudouridine(38-40) synthase TruA [Mucilaginibacter arboris]
MRYFFHIAYLGTNYSGWQKHPNTITVQQVLETKLSQVLKVSIQINGCGRTDAGVHASQFFFHADIDIANTEELQFRLNRALPNDIAVFDILEMQDKQHARFDACLRTYDYLIHTYKNPFISSTSSFYALKNLNIEQVKKAMQLLLLYQDYKAFCTTPNKYEHTICKISSVKLYLDESEKNIQIQISANRFLSKMIRIIVGKLLKIGTGKMSIDEFEHHLISKETPAILDLAYPQGLHLSKVTYPFLDLPNKAEILGDKRSIKPL